MSLENPNFLKKKYDLHKAPEVEFNTERTEKRTGETLPQKPEARIQNYLNRFKEITDREDSRERERGLTALKTVLHDNLVIKPEAIPESYFENQRRLAREQGHGDIEITDETREQLAEVIVTDQETTLDNWVDYLASDDATYPDWLKYYAFRSVVGLSTFNKEKHEFGRRDKGTTAPFPDINREALAYVLDAIEKKYDKKVPRLDAMEPAEQERFTKLLQGENFGKLYGFAIEQVTPAQLDQLTVTSGQWVKYDQNSDHIPLVESLQGYGTGWCTAGESTAHTQLQNGDFYVYYSDDQQQSPSIPRVAIRMEGDHIAEVRGIAHEQNLDPYIGEVVEGKLQELGSEGEAYQKKSTDMQRLTALDAKTKTGEELTQGDLVFLYEMESPIEGFGYRCDPRIEELRGQRDSDKDMLIIFGDADKPLTPDQVAKTAQEINSNTKAYMGQLESGIFEKIGRYNIAHVYTSFPEGRVRFGGVEIGTLAKEAIELDLKQHNVNLDSYAQYLLNSPQFTVAEQSEHLRLVALTVESMGFEHVATTAEIIGTEDDVDAHGNPAPFTSGRMTELGLELCPAEAGPHLRRTEDIEHTLGKSFAVAMKPIPVSDGYPGVFYLSRATGGAWLGADRAHPAYRWSPGRTFVFRFHKELLET